MYLCEEYILRNSLKFPYVKLVEFGANFIKNGSKWNILTINWKEPTTHPGHFIIKIVEPIHNGYKMDMLFKNVIDEGIVHLDEYEDFFIKWASDFNYRIARNNEVKIAAWETYLYCYDSLLVNFARMEELLTTIDQEAPVSERLRAIDETVFKLQSFSIIENWSNVMRKYITYNNNWLPELVDYMHGQSNSNQ